MTAKIVIASADRLIVVRQPDRKRYRIAEMRVPEWAIPTQKTKFVMYTPHMTGWVIPATPIPVLI
jgi:hypothetical protein